jgi:hypothetical protein
MNDCFPKTSQYIFKNSPEEDAVILDCITKARGQISQAERKEIDQLLVAIIPSFNREGRILLTTDELEDLEKGNVSEKVRDRLEFVLTK